MGKDNVVIKEGGYRFVMELGENDGQCDKCAAIHKCNNGMAVESLCQNEKHRCISATKITQESRIYHAWDREEAGYLVGKTVEFHGGECGHEWGRSMLESIKDNAFPFVIATGFVKIIREIPQIKMTWEEAKAKYGIGDEVVIVEGD